MACLLIIDDDPDIPALLKSLFVGQRGDEVVVIADAAQNAAQAVRTAEDLQPDVILLASNLSGVDVSTIVSQLRTHRSTSIVLYGAIAERDEERFAPLAATVTHLLSPISTDEFLAARDAAIERTVSHS
jgi:DNA-binding response OmpR family regulator